MCLSSCSYLVYGISGSVLFTVIMAVISAVILCQSKYDSNAHHVFTPDKLFIVTNILAKVWGRMIMINVGSKVNNWSFFDVVRRTMVKLTPEYKWS